MRLFGKRARLRPLDERECYLRLHGRRTGEVEVVELRDTATPVASPVPLEAPAPGPTDTGPALHLLITYPRNAGRLTGEELRRELLRRMQARTGEAA
ncbi:MAG TPA: hypothetical protein VFG85_10305 [Gaiellaceae bacterium]|nr:hypothetical protein [Gaiellaceae bacterium]